MNGQISRTFVIIIFNGGKLTVIYISKYEFFVFVLLVVENKLIIHMNLNLVWSKANMFVEYYFIYELILTKARK